MRRNRAGLGNDGFLCGFKFLQTHAGMVITICLYELYVCMLSLDRSPPLLLREYHRRLQYRPLILLSFPQGQPRLLPLRRTRHFNLTSERLEDVPDPITLINPPHSSAVNYSLSRWEFQVTRHCPHRDRPIVEREIHHADPREQFGSRLLGDGVPLAGRLGEATQTSVQEL